MLRNTAFTLVGICFSVAAQAAPFRCQAQTVGVSITSQTTQAITFSFRQGSGTGGARPWITLYTSNNRMLRSANGAPVQCQAGGGTSCTAVYTPGGPISTQVWAGSSLRPNADNPLFHSWCSGPINIDFNPTPPGCTVTGGMNRTIPLGDFGTHLFRSVGTTTGARPFSLGLACEANTHVTVVVTAARVADAGRGLVEVSGGAAGVAIQILDWAGNPVPLGTTIDYGRHGPGWDLPYSARYYQTSPGVTPGDANGAVTITLQYQ